VPSLEQITELVACPAPWCAFEYCVRYMDDKNPPYWLRGGFGFTKLDLTAQKLAPLSMWYHKGEYFNVDSRITGSLITYGLSPHVHGKVKHSRIVDWTGKTK
jgi:hypothetical protein